MAAPDPYPDGIDPDFLVKPIEDSFLVTPDDANDLPFVTRGVTFAVAGAVKVTTNRGTTLVFPSGTFAAGIIHPVRWKRIWSTSTTATGITGHW